MGISPLSPSLSCRAWEKRMRTGHDNNLDLYLDLVSVLPVIFQFGVGLVVVLTNLAHIHLTW